MVIFLVCVRDFIYQLGYKTDFIELVVIFLALATTVAGWGLRKGMKWGRAFILVASVVSILYCLMFLLFVGFHFGKFFATLALIMLFASIFSIIYMVDYMKKNRT